MVKGDKAQATTEKKTGEKKVPKVHRKNTAPIRLWVKAVFVGFRRGKHTQNNNQALLKIHGVNDKKDTSFYLGKRVAYVFKAHTLKENTKYRAIWGRVGKAHGNNGVVVARFAHNLPPRAISSTVRVMLYPNRSV